MTERVIERLERRDHRVRRILIASPQRRLPWVSQIVAGRSWNIRSEGTS
jgi:hypothetical protein